MAADVAKNMLFQSHNLDHLDVAVCWESRYLRAETLAKLSEVKFGDGFGLFIF